MSTRAIIHVYDDLEDETPITTIYKHFDGYPTKHGVGQTLKQYVMDSHIVEGLPLEPINNMHNGIGCFTAGLIKHLKGGPGDVYIEKPGTDDRYQSYIYTIAPSPSKGKLVLLVTNTSDNKQEILVPG
jgi:hypothetical protein